MSAYEFALANASAELEQELGRGEQMDLPHIVEQLQTVWRSLPPEMKADITQRGRMMFDLRGIYLARFVATVNAVFGRNPKGWQRALTQNPGGAAQQLAQQAGRAAGLRPRATQGRPGFSDPQVSQYHRRQVARGFIPGRSRQTGRYRELEQELEQAGYELETGEGFWTKVNPFPVGPGRKEGHEVLTRSAMRGFTLTSPEKQALLRGVITPDRGGMSYWKFPLAAIGSLRSGVQASHALRPNRGYSTPTAVAHIQKRFREIYAKAMGAKTRIKSLIRIGEALHLLQDSFSSAHTSRVGGTGKILKVRVFFIRVGWPPRSTAPGEHNAPSDDRDDINVGGAMRREARASIRVSRIFLAMALRHLRAPKSPTVVSELNTFISRFLSM